MSLKEALVRLYPFYGSSWVFGAFSFAMIKRAHPHLGCDFGTRFALFHLGDYSFGKNVRAGGVSATPGLSVGDGTFIGSGCEITCSPEYPVRIGKMASVAPEVFMSTWDHPTERAATTLRLPGMDRERSKGRQGRIAIGNDVWIGRRAVILRGVTIGDGAVVGAGAVVTKDVEPYSIAGGVPAKKIGMRFPPEVVAELEELGWWDWPEERMRRNRRFFETDLSRHEGSISELVED
jgi:acetyltransferase-like isoleucine patch superfamily enzyme